MYNILKSRFLEEDAQELVSYLEAIPRKGLATKEDIAVLKEKIGTIKEDMTRLELRLVKWVIGRGIGIVISTVGILVSSLRLKP